MARRLSSEVFQSRELGARQKLLLKKAFDLHVGSRGQDHFLIEDDGLGSGFHRLVNFKTGPQGDSLDLSSLLEGATAETLSDYINIKFTRGGATLSIDTDGDGSGYSDTVIKLHGIKLKTIDDLLELIDDGNLVISNTLDASWQAGDGSASYQGGSGASDTFTLGAVPADTQVVITPTPDGKVQIALSTGEVILIDDFEELIIEGSPNGDHVTIAGDFSGTDIAPSTFTYASDGSQIGTSGDDYFNAAELVSDHRVVVHGRAGEDTLIGGSFNDVLFGGADNDTLRGGPGSDNIVGGTGYDILEVSGSYLDYIITGDLSSTTVTGGPDGDDTLSGVEAIHFDEGPVPIYYLDGTPNAGQPPELTGFSASVDENIAAALLGTVGATDPEGGSVTFAIKDGPGSSLFAIDPLTGALSSLAAFDFEGDPAQSYSLTIVGTDEGGLSGEATVTVNVGDVNEAPVSANDRGAVNEGGTVLIDVSANDDDVDTDDDQSTLTYAITFPPIDGGAVNNNDGTITFDATRDFEGLAEGQTTDELFTYRATDSHGLTGNAATVSVTVTGTNDAPTSADDTGSTLADATTTIDVSANDDDIDSDDDRSTLTYILLVNPPKGSVANNTDGTFTFDPKSDFDGLAEGETETVSFAYMARDSHGLDGNRATVTITVGGVASAPNQAPLVEAGKIVVLGSGVGPIDLRIELPTDPDGDALTATLIGLPGNGTLTLPDGTPVAAGTISLTDLTSLRFDPGAGSDGTQSGFTYEVSDGNGGTAQSLVTLKVTAPPSDGSGFLMAGYTPHDGFGIYSVDNGVTTLLGSDIDGRLTNESSSYAVLEEMIRFKDAVYFNIRFDISTDELWKLKDGVFSKVAYGGANDVSLRPTDFVIVGDRLYFVAAKSIDPGWAPWRVFWTDGETFTEVDDGISGTWDVDDIVDINGKLYVAEEYGNWWAVDGETMSNTGQYANTYSSGGAVVNGKFYYEANGDLYSFDGTTAERVSRLNSGDFDPKDFHAYGSLLMFYADEPVNDNRSLYYSDGVNTYKMAEGAVKGGEMGGLYYFAMKPPSDGSEFWSFDGTFWSQAYLAPFVDSKGSIQYIQSTGDEILITWKPSGQASELWSYDGATYTEITVPIGFRGSVEAIVSGDQVILEGPRDGYGNHKSYVYDGVTLSELLSGGAANLDGLVSNLIPYDGSLYFMGRSGTSTVFYNFDGTTLNQETGGLSNINISQPWVELGGILYYFSEDYDHGRADRGTWSWDGTTAAFLSADYSFRPQNLQIFNGELRSTDDGFQFNNTLVKIVAGTSSNSRLQVEDTDGNLTTFDPFAAMTSSGTIYNTFVEAGGFLYFFGQDLVNGRELWSFDGTTTPVLVDDYHTGTDGFYGMISTASLGGNLYFNATWDYGNESAVFKSDGTSLTMLSDADNIGGYKAYQGQEVIMSYGGSIYFAADDAGGVRQVYVLVGDTPTPVSALAGLGITNGFEFDGTLMLLSESKTLYSFDGTSVSLVHNFLYNSSNNIDHTEFGGKLYFRTAQVDPATDTFVGNELFVWDGTTFSLALDINTTAYDLDFGGRQIFIPVSDSAPALLEGGPGNDILVSSEGSDTMTGNGGGDTFLFIAGDTGANVIKDFNPDEGDRVDLVGVFAVLGLGAADEIGAVLDSYMDFTLVGADTLLEIDLDGDAIAELSILFEGIDLVEGLDDAAVIDGALAGDGLDVI